MGKKGKKRPRAAKKRVRYTWELDPVTQACTRRRLRKGERATDITQRLDEELEQAMKKRHKDHRTESSTVTVKYTTTTPRGKTPTQSGGTTSAPSPSQDETTESKRSRQIKLASYWSKLLLPWMKFENHTVERVNADDFWRLDAELKELEHAPRPAPLQLQEGSRGMEQVEEQAAYPEVLAAHYNTGGFPHVWVKELDGSWTFTPVGPGPGDIIIRRKDG